MRETAVGRDTQEYWCSLNIHYVHYMHNKYVLVISSFSHSVDFSVFFFFHFEDTEKKGAEHRLSMSNSSFIVDYGGHFNSFCFVAPFWTTMKMTILILLCLHTEINGGVLYTEMMRCSYHMKNEEATYYVHHDQGWCHCWF